MVPLSVLDLSPITEGSDAGQALRNSLDLARHVEALGYRRIWMAEHHNLPGIASAATAVALAHVAAGTNTIRIGAGGIMLPNHAPLLIAEQFGTLAALHPERVELGLGRAPGSDQVTNRAVRRNLLGDVDQFPQDVVELMGYFQPAEPGQAVQAVPGAGLGDRRGAGDRPTRPRRFRQSDRRRRADGDGKHLRTRQTQTIVRDRRRSARRDEKNCPYAVVDEREACYFLPAECAAAKSDTSRLNSCGFSK